jgi:hypothetical protein
MVEDWDHTTFLELALNFSAMYCVNTFFLVIETISSIINLLCIYSSMPILVNQQQMLVKKQKQTQSTTF